MKKLLILLLAVCMPFAAVAEQAEVTANAVAESRSIWQITAPFSGVLKPFDWEMGDVTEAGNVLFELDTPFWACLTIHGKKTLRFGHRLFT